MVSKNEGFMLHNHSTKMFIVLQSIDMKQSKKRKRKQIVILKILSGGKVILKEYEI